MAHRAQGGDGGGNAHAARTNNAPFNGYVPRREGIVNPALFACYLDQKFLEPGEVVVVVGSCEALHGWDYGVELERDPADPNLWMRKIVMPFDKNERCYSGIFQFQFAIRSVGGDVWHEGGDRRTVRRMVPSFFGSFRYAKRVARFAAPKLKPPSKSTVAREFLLQALNAYEDNPEVFSAREVLEQFSGVDRAFEPTPEVVIAATDDHIAAVAGVRGGHSDVAILLATAMVGSAAESAASRERANAAALASELEAAGMSMAEQIELHEQQLAIAAVARAEELDGGSGNGGGKSTTAPAPFVHEPVTPWCTRALQSAIEGRDGWDNVLEELLPPRPVIPEDGGGGGVGALLEEQMELLMSGARDAKPHWCESAVGNGLRLAIARLEHGRDNGAPDYRWFTCSPLLNRSRLVSGGGLQGTVPEPKEQFSTSPHVTDAFLEATNEVFSRIDGHREKLLAQPPITFGDFGMGGGGGAGAGNLVAAMRAMGGAGGAHLLRPVETWMSTEGAGPRGQGKSDSVVMLEYLFRYAPNFQVVYELLRRCYYHKYGKEGLFNHALTGAARWIGAFPWSTTSEVKELTDTLRDRIPPLRTPAVAASVLRKECIDPMCASSDGLQEVLRLIHTCVGDQPAAYGGPAIAATRGWFKRRHGGPADGGQGQEAMLPRILAALQELNSLLTIPCFARDPHVLADELEFLKTAGDRRHTIELLAQIAKNYDDMPPSITTPVLCRLLKTKASATIADYFNSDRSAVRARWIVEVLTSAIPVTPSTTTPGVCFTPTVLGNFLSLIFSRAVQRNRTLVPHEYFVGADDLPSVLGFHSALSAGLAWATSPGNVDAVRGTALDSLLAKCLAAIRQLAHELHSRKIFLGSLRAVLRQPSETLALVDAASPTDPVSENMLQEYRETLVSFDFELEAVQYFLTSYCNDGDRTVYRVPTNVANLKDAVDEVARTLSHDGYQLLDIHGGATIAAVAEVLTRFGAVPTLHTLRNSEIFRELWQSSGDDVRHWPAPPAELLNRALSVQEKILASIPPPGNKAAADYFANPKHHASTDKNAPGVSPGHWWRKANASDGKAGQKRLENLPLNLSAKELTWLDCVSALAQEADDTWTRGPSNSGFASGAGLAVLKVHSNEPTFAGAHQPLHALHVQYLWLPLVLRRWATLQTALFDRSACIDTLEVTFGQLRTGDLQASCVRELAWILGLADESQVDPAIKRGVSDFVRLKQLRPQLSSLVNLFKSLSKVDGSTSSENDEVNEEAVDNELLSLPSGGAEETVEMLRAADGKLSLEWTPQFSPAHTLQTIGSLLDPIRGVAEALSPSQSEFLALLGENPVLVLWLRRYRDQDEFDNKLQVARGLGSITEPELISAIESLKRVRVALRSILYVEPDHRHTSFLLFLQRFAENVPMSAHSLGDMKSLGVVGERLLEVLDKQTKGAGVRNCYELVDIHVKGKFALVASQIKDDVLLLRVAGAPDRKLAYLQDLRAKLMMTEISAELDSETATEPNAKAGVKALLEAFASQLEVLERIRDQIHALCCAGHYTYQAGHEQTFDFRDVSAEALKRLEETYAANELELAHWNGVVDKARESCFFLNYFTMQELWALRARIIAVFETSKEAEAAVAKASADPSAKKLKDKADRRRAKKAQAIADVKTMLHLVVSSSKVVDVAVNCMTSDVAQTVTSEVCGPVDPSSPGHILLAIGKLLELCFPGAKAASAHRKLSKLDQSVENASDMLVSLRDISTGHDSGGASKDDGSGVSSATAPGRDTGSSSEGEHPIWISTAPDPEQPGMTLDMVLSVFVRRGRLPEPGEIVFCEPSTTTEELKLLLRRFISAGANHRRDFIFCLVNVDKLPYTEQVTLGKMMKHFIDTYGTANASGLLILSGQPDQHIVNAWSAYRVAASPLRAEILQKKCAEAFEDLREGRGGSLLQCVRSTINGGGKTHYVLSAAAAAQTSATASGSGEVKYFRFGYRENTTAGLLVRKLTSKLKPPHTSQSTVDSKPHSHFVHLDVGHVVPLTTNTVLFQLFFVGVISDQASGQIYHRDSNDTYMVEMANSPAVFELLRICRFLPGFEAPLTIGPDFLRFQRPALAGKITYNHRGQRRGQMVSVDIKSNDLLRHVCRVLKALDQGAFRQGEPSFVEKLNFDEIPVEPAECFALICKHCGLAPPGSVTSSDIEEKTSVDDDDEPDELRRPGTGNGQRGNAAAGGAAANTPGDELDAASWTVVSNFVNYIGAQFRGLEGHRGWCTFPGLVNTCGVTTLRLFRHQFLLLLLETTRDFAKRAVPRGRQFLGGTTGAGAVPTLSRQLSLRRQVSSSSTSSLGPQRQLSRQSSASDRARVASTVAAARERAEQEAIENAVLSSAIAGFEKMKNWEDTDHPIAVLYPVLGDKSRTQNFTLFALNRSHTARFIPKEMADAVQQQLQIDLSKDWSKITDAEGRRTISRLAGIIGIQDLQDGGKELRRLYDKQEAVCLNCLVEKADQAPPGYVMTVDNMAKMLSIYNRMITHLPVIIMGETGCGKSSLIRQMCALIKAPLRTLNIHGGMGDQQIIDWMWAQFKEFRQANIEENGGRFIVFLDEVNTCNSMALFKEILCDRMLEGMALPDSFIVVAACNPYRRRKQTIDANKHLEAGLKYQPAGEAEVGVAAVEEIDMKDLVYRVFPLPESMMDHVYDFGALDATTEQLYIEPKISKHLKHRPRIKTAKQVYIESGKGCSAEQWAELSDAQRKPFEAIVADAKLEATQRRSGFLALYAALICAAQEFVREQNGGERSSASLRDVDRCAQIFRWFGEHLAAEFGEQENWTLEDFLEVRPVAQRHVRTAVIMSIAYCYHARLDRKLRQGLRDRLSQCRASLLERFELDMVSLSEKHARAKKSASAQTDEELQATHDLETRALRLSGVEWLDLSSTSFMQEVERVQTYFVSNMKVGDGIARNEALCENLFMILVSVLNKVPIFVIGVPGSSKSLAMRLIQSNLRGSASSNEFLRKLPAVEVFPYQCSPQSTSQGIEQVFGSANRVAAEAQNTVVVVLLDEVGLAEYSPHLPLKVLHKLLDEAHGSQALVGISNWPLDPAKMNRAVHLYRPAPTAADLAVTASGIVESESLRPYLKALASAYHDVVEQQREQYRNETQADFWGLREFYSLVKKINFDIRRLRAAGEAEDLHPQQLLFSIQRNFGGRPSDMEPVLRIFFERLGKQQLLAELQRMPVLELVRENLGAMQESRHLMILTKNNATTALSLLYDNGLVGHENSEVIFGSDFPHDDSDLQIILNLQRIKKCMAEGRTVVLVHSREGFYETLYDLLNQNYTEHGGQLYARLAFGNSYVLCPLVKEFRVVVIVDQADAYTKLAPPLLNRFEKQVLTRQHLLGDDRRSQRVRDTVHRLKAFVHSFATVSFVDAEATAALDSDPAVVRDAFCGYHKDMLLSLAQSMELELSKAGSNTVTATAPKPLQRAIRRLLWCATPEAASRWMADTEAVRAAAQQVEAEFGIDIEKIYFQHQQHSNLPTFVRMLALNESSSSDQPPTVSDDDTFVSTENIATATVALTFAPFHHDTAALVNSVVEGVHAVEVTLHQLSSEHDLRSEVAAFCSGAKDGIPASTGSESKSGTSTQLLIIHCDPTVASAQRVEHAKYIVEQERAAQSAAEAAAAGAVKGVSRHILLLVHLPRGQAGQLIPVDFNKRWKYAFVDAIDSSDTNGMPDMQELLTMDSSMHVILQNLDLDRVFRSVFRSALANLKLPFRCGTEFYLHKIHSLQKLVDASGANTEPRFLAFAREIMCKVMEAENMSLNMNLSGRSDLLLRGTFQNCLHAQILAAARRALTVLLAHAERNSYLALLDVNALASVPDAERSHLSNLWYRLFRKSCPREIEEQAASAKSVPQAMVVVKMDSRQTGTRFEARFPFSHFVARLVETHRSIFVPQLSIESLVALETNLRNQVCALHRLELSLTSASTTDASAEPAGDELPPSLGQRYLSDFVMMFVLDDEHREVDAGSVVLPVTRKVLHLATGTAPTHPSDVHIRFWKYEDRLRQYLRLLNSLPSNRQQMVTDDLCALADASLITSDNPEVALDVQVVSFVLAQLESMVGDEAIEPATWLRTFHNMEEEVIQVMDDGIAALKSVDEPTNENTDGRVVAVEALCVRWEKLSLFAMFLRDVTIPLAPAMGVQQAHKTRTVLWAGMSAPDASIRSHWFFDSIFGLLRDVSAVLDAPSTASAFSRFVDVYISEYVFSSPIASQTQAAQSKVDSDLFKDVIGLLSKDSMTIADGREAATTALSLSLPESSRLSLMRTVLDVKEPSVKAKVDEFLEAALPWAVSGNGFLDEPLCVCYAYVREEMIHRKLQAQSGGDTFVHRTLLLAQQFQTEQAPLLQSPLSPEKVAASTGRYLRDLLDAIATARALYDIAADVVFEDPSLADNAVEQSPGAESHTDSAELVRVLNRCLVPTNAAEISDGASAASFSQSSYLQSLQIYLLKGLERRGGLSFLRGVLAKPAIGAADWCANGLKRSAVAHPHFTRWTMGSNLPTSNPMRDHPGAESMSTALDKFLQAEAATDLEGTFVAAARKFLTDESLGEAYLPGALLVAVFHKCYYLRAQALDMIPPQTRERVALLHEWLSSSGQAELKLPDLVLRMLLRFTTLEISVDELQAESHDAFFLGPNSTTNDILKTRVLVHMVAVASMGLHKSISGARPLLAFFTSVLYHPEKLNGSYFPQMPMDHLYYMMCNMRFAETGKRGRWMYCRNGHPYCVDACGRPTIVQKCSACGVLIGGLGHDQIEYIGDWNLGVHGQYGDPPALRPKGEVQKDRDVDPALQGNTNYYQVSTPQDNSAPQYCLTKGEEGSTTLADVSETLREVPARDCRTQRLLLHAALLAGAQFGGPAWLKKAADFSKAVEPNSEGLPALFAGRFLLDWDRMKKVLGSLGDDDTELILHAAISGFGEEAQAALEPGSKNNLNSGFLASRESRATWEQNVHKNILGGIVGNDRLSGKLAAMKEMYDDENEHRVGIMLQERALTTYDTAERARAAPALFRFRQAFAAETFEFHVHAARERFPLLHSFVTEPDQVRGAHHLADALDWMRLLTTQYNRRIAEKTAEQEIKVADVLAAHGQAVQWQRAWQGFEAAWALEAHLGVPIECGTITPEGIAMGLDSQLALCLPAHENQGLLTKALATILTRLHNNLRELAQEHLAARGGGVVEPSQVSSRNFTRTHTIHKKRASYEAAFAAFTEYVKRYCLMYSTETGKLTYDLAAAERWLVDEYFATCPTVKLELDMVSYLGESAISDALLSLKRTIPQEALPMELKAQLKRAVTNRTVAQSCIEELEQALVIMVDSIVQAEVGGDTKLWSVLMLQNDIFNDVRLKHVDALNTFLAEQVSTSEFPLVHKQYKVKFTDGFNANYHSFSAPSQEAVQHLHDAARRAEGLEVIVECMLELMESYLMGTNVDPSTSIRDAVMADFDEELEGTDFDLLFPEGEGSLSLNMAHFIEAYKVLDQANNFVAGDV